MGFGVVGVIPGQLETAPIPVLLPVYYPAPAIKPRMNPELPHRPWLAQRVSQVQSCRIVKKSDHKAVVLSAQPLLVRMLGEVGRAGPVGVPPQLGPPFPTPAFQTKSMLGKRSATLGIS